MNGDYFTVGDTGEEDIPLPAALRGPKATKLRFSRGAEGWRVTAADNLPLYVNQRRTLGLTDIESGDVIRLVAGGPGLQFLVRKQDASLARLASRFVSKRPAPTPTHTGGKPHPEPVVSAAKPTRWLKNAAVAVAVVTALALAYFAGSTRSTPGVTPASAEEISK